MTGGAPIREDVALPPPLPAGAGSPLTPVTADERMLVLDVLRGFALFGILVSNILYFSQPEGDLSDRAGAWIGPWDRVADWFVVLLVEAKFYPLFAILFGIGVSIQMERSSIRTGAFKTFFKRRLLVLMMFGIAHSIFLWDGDILFHYALCGVFLLLFQNRKSITATVWAFVLILIPVTILLLIWILLQIALGSPEVSKELSAAMKPESFVSTIFIDGSYVDVVTYRLSNLIPTALFMLIFDGEILGLLLFGMVVGRSGILMNLEANRQLFEKMFWICGLIGIAINTLAAWASIGSSVNPGLSEYLLGLVFSSLGGPILALSYASGIILLIVKMPAWCFFQPFAAAGRMALTNYLLQSLIATTIFYGYGFGLIGQVGRLGTIGIAMLIFAAQLLFSTLWLQRYQAGPVEWLWRKLAYGSTR